MVPIVYILWITCIRMVAGVLECPAGLTSRCSCGETIDWIDEEWQTVSFINCSSSGLNQIPDFSSLREKQIDRILLKDNNITEIDSHQLLDLDIKELVLSQNPLKQIKRNTFDHIRTKIERLDLSGVKLTIDEGLEFLKDMTNLKALDLGYNVLSKSRLYNVFQPGLFIGLNLTALRTLTLQALQMTKLEIGAFQGIESIEQLDMSYNFLPELPLELQKLKDLKQLKLYSNEIMALKNNSFTGMTKLKTLLIGANDLDTIEMGSFNDLENSLEELNLYFNHLPSVPTEALAGLKELKKLSLVKNDIVSIENGTFVGDYQLERLELDDNPLLVLQDEGAFHGIEESLTTLYIRNLNLTKLPLHILSRLPSLEYLDATDNKIKVIDDHFFKGLQLNSVYLMWNRIRTVDPRAFDGFQKGVTLDLHENRLTNVSFVLDVEPCTFETLDVSQNSIECDCDLEEVLHSGLVSWEIIGECYIRSESVIRWYNFQDTVLRSKLEQMCNVTTPYSYCNKVSKGNTLLSIIPCHVLVIYAYLLMFLT